MSKIELYSKFAIFLKQKGVKNSILDEIGDYSYSIKKNITLILEVLASKIGHRCYKYENENKYTSIRITIEETLKEIIEYQDIEGGNLLNIEELSELVLGYINDKPNTISDFYDIILKLIRDNKGLKSKSYLDPVLINTLTQYIKQPQILNKVIL